MAQSRRGSGQPEASEQVSRRAGRTRARRPSHTWPHSKFTWEERTPPAQLLSPALAVCWAQSWCLLGAAALEQAPELPG